MIEGFQYLAANQQGHLRRSAIQRSHPTGVSWSGYWQGQDLTTPNKQVEILAVSSDPYIPFYLNTHINPL